MMIKNALTVDVEDWHHCMVSDYHTWTQYEDRIVYSTNKVLKLFRETETRATFFILGYVAEQHPELVEQIRAGGHEVANHGQHHEFVYKLTPDQFRADLERSAAAIERVTGERPVGYRAPFFSITKESWWALDILLEMGYRYDSSIYPVINHRYGVPDAPRFPYRITGENGSALAELPIATLKLGLNLPVGGGVYFRAMPYPLIRAALSQLNRGGTPAMVYFHPWEIDPEQPVLDGLPYLFKARRYLGLKTAEDKWRALLSEFAFAPASEVFDHAIQGNGSAAVPVMSVAQAIGGVAQT